MPELMPPSSSPPPGTLWDSTRRQAGDVAATFSGQRRSRILQLLRDRGPMTIWEIAAEMSVFDNQISGRFGELERDGLIQKTGQRKPNPRTGCDAEVYAIADVPSSLIPHPSSFGVYPGTLVLDGEPYHRQEPIGPHDAPGVPYARTVDNKVRFQVRVELVECPGCGHPLRVIERRSTGPQTHNIYRCGTPTCNVTWHLALVNEPGQPQRLALVIRNL